MEALTIAALAWWAVATLAVLLIEWIICSLADLW
jgi:hypothetical protein